MKICLQIIFTIPFIASFMSCEKMAVTPDEETPLISDILLYSKNPNGHNELYKLENGEESVLISDPNFDFWWAKVSPNKQNILYYRSPKNPDKNHDDYPNAELVLSDISGQNSTVLISKNDYGWKAQGVARWNKNGTSILMCAEVKVGNNFQWRLIETNSVGKEPKILSERWAIDCNFSPDNQSVVYMGFKDNNLTFDLTKLELQIGEYDPVLNAVKNIESLTNNTTRDHDPAFSPDGKQIVFSGGNALYSNVDLILYDISEKSERILLDDDNANGGSMCWSKDGKYVYFHSLDLFKLPFRIKRIEVATGTETTILKTNDNSFGFFHPEVY